MQKEANSHDTIAAWQERALKELKGRPLESLNWKNDAELDLLPYYTPENARLDYPVLHSREAGQWDMFEPLEVGNVKASNQQALDALSRGATAVVFKISPEFRQEDLSILLQDIELPYIQSGFQIPVSIYESFCLNLAEYIRKRGWDPRKTEGFIQVSFKGLDGAAQADSLLEAVEGTAAISAALVGFRLLVMDVARFREQGALDHQELALLLAWFHEWLLKLESLGTSYEQVPKLWQANLSAGGDYFLQIAKFRAANHLLSQVGAKFGAFRPMYLFAESSRFNLSQLDRYNNLLRLSVSSMAASAGGANGVVNYPFTRDERDSEGFVHRVSRNIQLMLFHESGFGDTQDPARGSFYVEELTHALAEKAWESFLEIEEEGGLAAIMRNGYLEKMLSASREKQLKEVASGKRFYLGVNKFPKAEPVSDQEDLRFNWEKPFLGIRRKLEEKGRNVSLSYLLFGDAGMSNARQSFAANFLGCAGLFGEPVTQEAAWPESDIVVLCADDASYREQSDLSVKSGQLVIMAGDPGEDEANLRAKGIHLFLHRKSHLIDTLNQVLEGLS